MLSSVPPVVLTIAGSDCSGGAGLQADCKTFASHQCYGLSVVTCIVSETPGIVSRIQPADSDMVADQLQLLLQSFPVAALKTGMLYSRDIISAIATLLRKRTESHLVVDPVMVATSGDPLLQKDAIAAYEQKLFPHATLITPNMDEAAVLLGNSISHESELIPAATALYQRYNCSVLLKGGHLRGADAVDILCHQGDIHTYRASFIPNVSTHGTGCTYAAAITARLAQGHQLPAAVHLAKQYVSAAIRQSFRWGSIHALNHQVTP